MSSKERNGKQTKTNNMSEFKLLIKEQRAIEMELQVQAINSDVVSNDLSSLYGISTEERLYDRLIEIGPINNCDFIMRKICPRQRAEFFDRVSVVNAYELDGMSEREYMANLKIELYTKYLNEQ